MKEQHVSMLNGLKRLQLVTILQFIVELTCSDHMSMWVNH